MAVLIAALAVAGFAELARMAAAIGVRLLPISGIVGVLALCGFPFWSGVSSGGQPADSTSVLVLLAAVLAGVFIEQMIRARTDDAFRRISATLLAVLYPGAGGALILALRITHGTAVLVVFLAGVKGMDIAAYFTGKAIGRHKMIPWLSPGKSWEGLIGGTVVAAAGGAALSAACGASATGLPWIQAALFGALVGLAGQVGDLCESLLKRSARVKDSGAVLPEFGGVLDVLDSPLLAAPVAHVLLWIM
jgi:phosphatidate cytidylyltransferase